jgi:hypothetical protein
MNSRDLCFLGLLALAYLYLDARGAQAAPHPHSRPHSPEQEPTDLWRATLPARVEPACPRQGAHPVSRRADGAVWCHHCDEGFYPIAPEWDWIMAGAAA